MQKMDTDVKTLVGMIERGQLKLPEMQRQFVWTSTMVRNLLDSLYRGYPTGSILVWETPTAGITRDLQIQQASNVFSSQLLLLDGQQRLTSLSAVLRGVPINVKDRKRQIDIAFNLDHPENAFSPDLETDESTENTEQDADDIDDEEDEEEEVESQTIVDIRTNKLAFATATSQLLKKSNWVSVSEVFQSEDEWKFLKRLVESPGDPNYTKYTNRLRKLRQIKDYKYHMEILNQDLRYEEVTQIFVRVNSLGAKLKGSDLALAQITAKWPGALAQFEDYAAQYEKHCKYNLEMGLLVRTLVVFATRQSRFERIGTIEVEKLQSAWESAKDAIDFAGNFLRTNAGIEAMSLLSSPSFLIPIAFYGSQKKYSLSPSDRSQMLQWLFAANIKGHYSGSSETTLDADLKALHDNGNFGILIEGLVQKFGRLNVEADDLKDKGTRSSLFSLSYLALKHCGARDWNGEGLGLSLTHKGHRHLIQHHHIFPRAVLKKSQIQFKKSEVNEIANLAFISGRVNREISSKPPADYFPNIIAKQSEEVLLLQAIDMRSELWEVENFRQFLKTRRERLAELINSFVDRAVANGQVR